MRLLLAILAAVLVSTSSVAASAAEPQRPSLKGEVLEAKDVETYTYLRLKTADGETWAAVNQTAVKKGAQVTIENATPMTNFQSKALNRKFDKIVFGTITPTAGDAAPATAPGAAPAGGGMGAMHAGMAKPIEAGKIKVPKATGADARTVAEIVSGSAQLKNKTVALRAKVVKFTPGVMGKNWLHVRDGTGSAADSTDDIVVTTKDETKVGDVVLVKGVVHTDVDLGSGYSYKVLVEEATLQK